MSGLAGIVDTARNRLTAAAFQAACRRALAETGALVLFRGRNAVHRVAPVEGTRTRMLVVLAYNAQPGIALSESARTTFYGRLDQLANTTILHHLRDVRRRSAGACGKRRSSKRAACTGAPDPTRKSPASALGLRWINDFTTATS